MVFCKNSFNTFVIFWIFKTRVMIYQHYNKCVLFYHNVIMKNLICKKLYYLLLWNVLYSVKKLSAENIQNDPTFNFTIQGNSCGFSSHPLYIRSSGSSGVRFSSILGGCVIPCLPLKIWPSKLSTEFSWLSDQVNLEPGSKFDEGYLFEKLG